MQKQDNNLKNINKVSFESNNSNTQSLLQPDIINDKNQLDFFPEKNLTLKQLGEQLLKKCQLYLSTSDNQQLNNKKATTYKKATIYSTNSQSSNISSASKLITTDPKKVTQSFYDNEELCSYMIAGSDEHNFKQYIDGTTLNDQNDSAMHKLLTDVVNNKEDAEQQVVKMFFKNGISYVVLDKTLLFVKQEGGNLKLKCVTIDQAVNICGGMSKWERVKQCFCSCVYNNDLEVIDFKEKLNRKENQLLEHMEFCAIDKDLFPHQDSLDKAAVVQLLNNRLIENGQIDIIKPVNFVDYENTVKPLFKDSLFVVAKQGEDTVVIWENDESKIYACVLKSDSKFERLRQMMLNGGLTAKNDQPILGSQKRAVELTIKRRLTNPDQNMQDDEEKLDINGLTTSKQNIDIQQYNNQQKLLIKNTKVQ